DGASGGASGAAAPPRAAPPARAVGSGPARADATAGPNATDIAWLQLLAAMDEQALHLMGLAPGRGADARLARWAESAAAGHRAQLARVRELLAAARVTGPDPHEGHDMPGMVGAAELRTLEASRGAAFDRLLRAALREHLDQARHLSRARRAAGSDPAVGRLARDVERTADGLARSMPS
ncbi:DUF305 domain-containing protein, partial [Streptomyces capparidis]